MTIDENHHEEKLPNWIDAYVGRQVKRFREKRGLSQSFVARSFSRPITFQQIQKYETATNRISASSLWELSQILNIPLIEFFPRDNPEQYEPPPLPGHVHLMQTYLVPLQILDALTPRKRRLIFALLREVARR